jgi:hypothetical protein
MGAATYLPASHFKPFFESLRSAGFLGTSCLFTAHLSPADLDELRALADQVIEVDDAYERHASSWPVGLLGRAKFRRGLRKYYPGACSVYERLARVRPGSAVARDLEFRLEGLQSLRYGLYHSYLSRHDDYDVVMIADLRDVIFQADPFAERVEDLELFLEEPSVSFDQPGFNQRWITDLYGSDALADLRGRIVTCSGVTFGDRSSMLAYLETMAAEIDLHLPPLGPHDQAVHNWLTYSGKLPNARLIANGSGRVLTMGAMSDAKRRSDGLVLNHDGSVPAVLHQYDRHVALAEELLQPYRR